MQWLQTSKAEAPTSENQLADLAGNAFAACVALRILCGILLVVGKRTAACKEETELDFNEIADLMKDE